MSRNKKPAVTIKKNQNTSSAAKIYVGSNTIADSPTTNEKSMPNKVRSHENLQTVSAMIANFKKEETKTDKTTESQQQPKNNIYKP